MTFYNIAILADAQEREHCTYCVYFEMNLFISAPAIPIHGRMEDIALIDDQWAVGKSMNSKKNSQRKSPVPNIGKNKTSSERGKKVND